MRRRRRNETSASHLVRALEFIKQIAQTKGAEIVIAIRSAWMKRRLESRRQNTAFIAAGLNCGLLLLFAVFGALVGGILAFVGFLLGGLLIELCLYGIAPRFFRSFDPRRIRRSMRDISGLSLIVGRMSEKAHIVVPSFLLWETTHVFACCVPSGHNDHFVILTTSLVDGLTTNELTAVVAHEISHIEQNDARWRKIFLGLTSVLSRAARPVGALLYPLIPIAVSLGRELDTALLAGERNHRNWCRPMMARGEHTLGIKLAMQGWSRSFRLWAPIFCVALPYFLLCLLLCCGFLLYMPALLSASLAFAIARTQELIADDGAALLTLQPVFLADALTKVHKLQVDERRLSFAEALFSLENAQMNLDWNDPFAEWVIIASPKIRAISQKLLRSHPDVDFRIKRLKTV